MPRIDIIRKPDGTIAFDPLKLRGAAIGDRIFWRNLDPQEKHWITPKGKSEDFWFRFPVERFVPGIPADTTREVVLQKETDITYVSFSHPDKIRHRFVDFPGSYVLHCHMLAHEDRGMMQLVRVIPGATFIKHH